MHYIKILALLIVVIHTFSSCTVEKRRYMAGYNVDWNKSNNVHELSEGAKKVTSENAQCNAELSKAEDCKGIIAESDTNQPDESVMADISQEKKLKTIVKKSFINQIDLKLVEQQLLPNSENKQKSKPDEIEKKRKKKKKLNTKRIGIISLIESVLAWVVLLIAVGMLVNGASLSSLFWLSWLAFLLAFNAVIGAFRVLKNTKAGKKKTGRGAAMAALAIGGIYLIFTLIARARA